MTLIQMEIYKALEQLSEKSTFTEYILAKKIRENIKLEGKQKAGIGYKDLEEAVVALGEQKEIFYSLHLNSANDLLIKKDSEPKILTPEAKQRRKSSEKSMIIFSNSDVKNTNILKGNKKNMLRSERKKINIHGNFEEDE